jgi:hypothetical protein
MKNGLKGVTDAMVFCKSMKKGGPKAMIQPMSKYMAGGTAGLQVAETESADSAKPPRWLRNLKRNMSNMKLRNNQKSSRHRCTGVGCVE